MRSTIPNQLTLLRILLTPFFLFFILKRSTQDQFIASLIFCVASLTDWYDGWYARKYQVITRWGQFMDPLADKILVSSALIVFSYLNYVYKWMVWVIVIRDFFITFLRLYALYVGQPIITHILAKWKTALQMATIFLILLIMNWHNLTHSNPNELRPSYFNVIGICLDVVTLLTVVSGIIYVIENWKVVQKLFRQVFYFLLFFHRK